MFFHGLNCFAVMKYDNVCLTVGRPAGAPLTRKLQMWKKACAALSHARIRVEHWCAKTPKINSLKMSRWCHSLKHLRGIYRVLVLWKMKRAPFCSTEKGFI